MNICPIPIEGNLLRCVGLSGSLLLLLLAEGWLKAE